MEEAVLQQLRFPIGEFERPEYVSESDLQDYLRRIETLPERLRRVVALLEPAQLGTRYRPGGWTVAQVIHHLGDSHMNAITRIKLALTEEHPTIRTYHEDRFAELADYTETPIDVSLDLLEALHARWITLLKSLEPTELERPLLHPEFEGSLTVAQIIAMYAWHGDHHLAHITELVHREGWASAD